MIIPKTTRWVFTKFLYNPFLRICLLVLLLGCLNKPEPYSAYYTKDHIALLTNHLNSLGISNESMQNHVFLLSPSLSCPPFFEEAKYWQEHHESFSNIDFSMIIVTKYEMSAQALIKANGLNFSFAHDSSHALINQKILPELPLKLFFDKNGYLSKISPMDGSGNYEKFIHLLSAQ